MNDKFLKDEQIDLAPISKSTIAVIGYGSQGRAHALNLRDSGINVIVGQRSGNGFDSAVIDGFQPLSIAEATAQSQIVSIMLPDEFHGLVFENSIKPNLNDNHIIVTCHGFSLHYGLIVPPPGISTVMVAPKGAGHRVRSAFKEGHGVPCLVAPGPGSDPSVLDIGLAYAKALGGGRAGVMKTTVAEETETDLFGEQAVLCGGVSALVKAGFETLVEAGYQPEVAYFECVHELKLVVDLLHKGGLAFMRDHISNTAEFGDYTRGPRVVGDASREAMQDILKEIQSGHFAKEWIDENTNGLENVTHFREAERAHSIETVGKKIIELEK